MIFSLNRFIAEFEDLVNHHEMVELCRYGDILTNFERGERKYISVYWNFQTGSIDKNYINLNVQIMSMGWMYDDHSNHKAVASDTNKIINDIFSAINYSNKWQQWGKVDLINTEPFIERMADKLTGWIGTFQFKLKRLNGLCGLPFDDYNFDKSTLPQGNPVLIFENDILVATKYGGDTYSYTTGTCNPVTSTFNSTNLVPTPSGEEKTIILMDSEDTEIGSIDNDTANVLILRAGNSDVELNGIKVGEVVAEGTINIAVVQDSLPTGAWNGTEFVIPSCPPSAEIRGRKPLKTNQVASAFINDDGWFKRGREVDFFNLPYNNFFGNTKRFTGTTGGYQDETDNLYYDKDGNLSNRATQFPEEIILDWSTWENDNLVYGYLTSNNSNFTGNQNWETWMTNSPYNTTSWNDFYVVNAHEMTSLISYRIGHPYLNYPPFNFATASAVNFLYSATQRADFVTNIVFLGSVGLAQSARTSNYKALLVRIFNTSEL